MLLFLFLLARKYDFGSAVSLLFILGLYIWYQSFLRKKYVEILDSGCGFRVQQNHIVL